MRLKRTVALLPDEGMDLACAPGHHRQEDKSLFSSNALCAAKPAWSLSK